MRGLSFAPALADDDSYYSYACDGTRVHTVSNGSCDCCGLTAIVAAVVISCELDSMVAH